MLATPTSAVRLLKVLQPVMMALIWQQCACMACMQLDANGRCGGGRGETHRHHCIVPRSRAPSTLQPDLYPTRTYLPFRLWGPGSQGAGMGSCSGETRKRSAVWATLTTILVAGMPTGASREGPLQLRPPLPCHRRPLQSCRFCHGVVHAPLHASCSG